MTRRALTGLLFGLVFLAGCPSAAERIALKDCQFNVRDVRIERFSPFELQLAVVVGIYNPNTIQVVVDRLDYVALVDGRRAADGFTHAGVTIPVNQSRDLTVMVRVNTVDAAQVALNLRRKNGHGTLTVRGTYYVDVPWGEYPFPVEVSHGF